MATGFGQTTFSIKDGIGSFSGGGANTSTTEPAGFNHPSFSITDGIGSFSGGSANTSTAEPAGLNKTSFSITGSVGNFSVGSANTNTGELAPQQVGSRFSDLYKTKGKEGQVVRAEEQLYKQKEKRYDYLNHIRKLTDLFAEEEEEDVQLNWAKQQALMGLPIAQEVKDAQDARKKRKDDRKDEIWRFKNQLMHSEWLIERPENFESDYVMIPVPTGKRNLVIASGGQTSAYSKSGMCISRFSSHLPGGGKHRHKWNFESAILDVVYNDLTKTYYILDMMCWRQTPMYDTETEFRFYWMHEKFLEVPEIATISKNNPYRFEPLPNFRCSPDNITNMLSCNMSVPLDGLLFYHKLTHYTFGFSPLVLWLRPYMIPEALGVMIPQKFIDRAPPDYKGYDKFKVQCIQNLEARDVAEKLRHEKKNEKKRARIQEKMGPKTVEPVLFVKSGGLSADGTNTAQETTSMET